MISIVDNNGIRLLQYGRDLRHHKGPVPHGRTLVKNELQCRWQFDFPK